MLVRFDGAAEVATLELSVSQVVIERCEIRLFFSLPTVFRERLLKCEYRLVKSTLFVECRAEVIRRNRGVSVFERCLLKGQRMPRRSYRANTPRSRLL